MIKTEPRPPESPSPKTRQELDRTLVAHAQAGSEEAFAKLHTLYARPIYRIALTITKNHFDAEDAAQDAFLRAYSALKGFRKEAQFFSWLVRIAINSSLMVLRRRRHRQEFTLDIDSQSETNLFSLEVADPRPGPDETLQVDQTYACVERSLNTLPKSLRIVAELQFVQEHSIGEMSAALGLSHAATKSRLYRARQRMTSTKWLEHHLRQQCMKRSH